MVRYLPIICWKRLKERCNATALFFQYQAKDLLWTIRGEMKDEKGNPIIILVADGNNNLLQDLKG